jgi:alkylhydroperoxidase family enzyme
MDDHARNAVAALDTKGTDATNFLHTMARVPSLLEAFATYAGAAAAAVDLRARELVALRVAWRTRCWYQWAHHIDIAAAAGLGPEDVARASSASTEPGPDASLIRFVDELLDSAIVSDTTWSSLVDDIDERAALGLIALIGQLTATAMMLNTAGIEVETSYPHRPATW